MLSECIDFESPPIDPEDLEVEDEEQAADDSPKARGTAKHTAVATILKGTQEERQKALAGLTDREREDVQWVVRKVIEIVEANGYSTADLRVEQRVTMLKPDSFEVEYFGTYDGEVGPIDLDWKFGEERNYFTQLVGYARPKLELSGEPRRFGYLIYGRLRRVTRHVLERKTVQMIADSLLARRQSPDRKPTICQYCGWCAKKATCSALTATSLALVERRDDWTLKLPSPHVSQLGDPVWMGAARYVWLRYLKSWGEGIGFASSNMAAAGIAPTGFSIRTEKGRTGISDTRAAFEALQDVVPVDILWRATHITLGALTDGYAEYAGTSKDKAREIILGKLAKANLLEVGDPVVKLVAVKNAEALIRAAIAAGALDKALEGEIRA